MPTATDTTTGIRPMTPYSRQTINAADIEAVTKVLSGDWLTQGPSIAAFEQAVATFVQAPHAIAVSNATAALHLVYQALGLGTGDWLWTTPNTFVATSNAALYCGAHVDFVDTDPATANLCPVRLREKLESHRAKGNPLPKIVTVVHFAGQPVPMTPFAELATEFGFILVEDASHALGATHVEGPHYPVGSAHHSAAAIFSFHPVKMIATGEGGMVTTRNPELARQIDQLRSHGITREGLSPLPNTHWDGPWRYEQQSLGYNVRMTDMQAALGASQMQRLPEFVAERRRQAYAYDAAFATLTEVTPVQTARENSSHHLYPVHVPATQRRALYDYLRNQGIATQVHYIPVHTQPYYQQLGFDWGHYPNAEAHYQQTLSLPLFPGLTEAEQHHVITSVYQFFGHPAP